MRIASKLSIFFLLAATLHVKGVCQIPDEDAYTNRHFLKGGVVQAIPNPKDKLSIAILAGNPSVARALGLGDDTLAKLRAKIHLSRGELNGGVLSWEDRFPTVEEVRAAHEKIRAENENALDELISPTQWVRLRQLAFQIEVSRIGLGKAMTEGLLSEEVGVYENQKSRISRKASEIDARAAVAIAEILRSAQEELIEDLPPEQRVKAKAALGPPFWFTDDSYRNSDPNRFKD